MRGFFTRKTSPPSSPIWASTNAYHIQHTSCSCSPISTKTLHRGHKSRPRLIKKMSFSFTSNLIEVKVSWAKLGAEIEFHTKP